MSNMDEAEARIAELERNEERVHEEVRAHYLARIKAEADNARLRAALESIAGSGLAVSPAMITAREALAGTPVQASAPPQDEVVHVPASAWKKEQGWKDEYELVSRRLDQELARNTKPSQHDFIDDPNHPDECRQAVFDGGARRCCGYPKSEHRDAPQASAPPRPMRDGGCDGGLDHVCGRGCEGTAPQASAPGRVPLPEDWAWDGDLISGPLDFVVETVSTSGDDVRVQYSTDVESNVLFVPTAVLRALLGAPSPERDIRGAVDAALAAVRELETCWHGLDASRVIAAIRAIPANAQPVTPSEPRLGHDQHGAWCETNPCFRCRDAVTPSEPVPPRQTSRACKVCLDAYRYREDMGIALDEESPMWCSHSDAAPEPPQASREQLIGDFFADMPRQCSMDEPSQTAAYAEVVQALTASIPIPVKVPVVTAARELLAAWDGWWGRGPCGSRMRDAIERLRKTVQ